MDRETEGVGIVKQEIPIWVAELLISSAVGAVAWTVIDAMVKDTTGMGLGVSAALALAIAHYWSAKEKKRRAWRAAEAAALSPTSVS